ncbi:MAG: hypothetical protein BWY66_00179 [bacterium ADurb.Bin374]|nr:MAG: hypothetical protein BWY66_00179 [bacterium ADurb.Bin374]
MHQSHGVGVVGYEGQVADDHLVEGDADRVDVGSVIHVTFSEGLFGRHVIGRAEREAASRLAGVQLRLGDAEIGEFHLSVARQEDVAGLDVPMDDPFAMTMRQGLQGRANHLDDELEREALVGVDLRFEGLPVDVFHDEVGWKPFALADFLARDIDDLDDIGAFLEPLHRSGLVEETADDVGLVDPFLEEEFDGRPFLEHRVLGKIYGGKAAIAQFLDDGVIAGSFAVIVCHGNSVKTRERRGAC